MNDDEIDRNLWQHVLLRLSMDLLNKPGPRASLARVSAHHEAMRYVFKTEGVTAGHVAAICLWAGYSPESVRRTLIGMFNTNQRIVRRIDFAETSV